MRAPFFRALVALSLVLIGACDDRTGSLSSGGPSRSTTSGGSSSSSGDDSSGGEPDAPVTFISSPTQGIATFYDADGSGNCSFDASPNDLDVVALAMPDYAGSAACGGCLRVKGPKGEVTVRVVDSCPPCQKSQIDLSAEAFAKIANPDDGRVSITLQSVSCPVGGNVAYHFKEGSSSSWTAIQVRNHRLPITKLEVKKSGSYTALTREDYNYFVASSGVGSGSITVRVTASDGQTIEDTLPGVEAGQTVTGSAQFK